jgi:hypothetical protein
VPLLDRLGTLRPPTLLIAGSIDTLAVARARAVAAAAPPCRAAVLVVEGAGHAAHLAAPDVVRSAILDHLVAAGSTADRAASGSTADPAAASTTPRPAVASPGAPHGRTP